jgi:2-iminobutanoate/2-iminopropanoate deaminase
MEMKMAEKKALETDKAAIPGGPYSQAIIYNGIIYLSGQGPIDPQTNQVVHGTIEQETELSMENIRIILEEAGSSLSKVLQITAYLLNMREYGRFNEVYRRYFPEEPPARTCIQAARLPFDIRVEISAIACISC